MHIAALVVRLEITDGLTLKDKRHVVRSLLDRIRGRFNGSAAEVGENDSVRYAELAAVAGLLKGKGGRKRVRHSTRLARAGGERPLTH